MKIKQLRIVMRSYVIHVVANVADLVKSGKLAPALMLNNGLAVEGISSEAESNKAGIDGRNFYVDQRGGFVNLTQEFSLAGEPKAAWWCPTEMIPNLAAIHTCKPHASDGHVLLQLAGQPAQKGVVRINFFVAVEHLENVVERPD